MYKTKIYARIVSAILRQSKRIDDGAVHFCDESSMSASEQKKN